MFLKTNAKTPTEATAINPELYPTNESKPQFLLRTITIKQIIDRTKRRSLLGLNQLKTNPLNEKLWFFRRY